MASSISSMATANPSLNQAYLSTNSPLQAFEGFSIEKELAKPIARAPHSLDRKRKRGRKSSDFVVLKPDRTQDLESSVDEDAVKSKLEHHFNVLRDISENERLRAELNRTLAFINLYEDYKQQKKKKEGSKAGKVKKSRKVL